MTTNSRKRGCVWLVRDPLFGDGGKAKIVDTLLHEHDEIGAVVRFHGGDNAGHTIAFGDTTLSVHAVPSGVVMAQRRKLMNVIGRGMVVNLTRLFAEIQRLAVRGINVTPDILRISEGTHLTLAYHMALERAREASNGKMATTSRAISQTYATNCLYQGVRAGDLRNMDRVRRLIADPLAYTNAILEKVYGQPTVSVDEVMAEIEAYRDRLMEFLCNEILLLNQVIANGEVVMAEGAQSLMLDRDLGIYPNTTASNTGPGAIQPGCGLDPRLIERDILVIKAYISRVGHGHLVAELTDQRAETIRERGKEFGTTTGRPRRIGRPDDMIANLCRLAAPGTEIAVTKLDILTGLSMEICTSYRIGSYQVPIFPTTVDELENCKPVLEEMPRWDEDFTGATNLDDLPAGARAYLDRLIRPYGCPMTMIGTGPKREQLIMLNTAA